jgi:diguanylate cyclase (GGDEF)-like protein/PAS domain S-box-containing protein
VVEQRDPMTDPDPPAGEPGPDPMELLTHLSRRVGSSLDLHETLEAVATAVVEALGFAVAVVNLVVEDGSLEAVVVAGPAEVRQALLGSRQSRHNWMRLLEVSEPWGRLRFLDHRHAGAEPADMLMWVPDLPASQAPDAWHPEDALFASLRASDGELLGVLSVDLPRDGRRPDAHARSSLEAFAIQAELAIEHAAVYSRLRHSEGLFRAVVYRSPIPIGLLDAQRCFVEVNEAFCRLLGRPAAELLGHTPLEFTHPDDQHLGTGGEDPGPGEPDPPPVVKRYLRPDATVVWGRLHVTRLHDHARVRLVAHVEDVTQARQLESRLRHDASHDALTGLPNRSQVLARLAERVGRDRGDRPDRREPGPRTGVCVLFCDLDRFKVVNDTHGHAVGDVLLGVVAQRLTEALRVGDIVGRLGGDEFVVVGDRVCTPAEAVALAERLAEVIAGPVLIGDLVLEPTLSVGVALSEPSDGPESLLHKADMALYAAKAGGRRRWHLFEPDGPGSGSPFAALG